MYTLFNYVSLNLSRNNVRNGNTDCDLTCVAINVFPLFSNCCSEHVTSHCLCEQLIGWQVSVSLKWQVFFFVPLWIANELFWGKCKFKKWKWNTLNSRWMTRISMRKKIAILKGRNMNGLTAIEEYGELFLLLSIILPKRGIAEYIFPLLYG